MDTLRNVVFQRRIGSHLNAALSACPFFGGTQQLRSHSYTPVVRRHVPTFDVADRMHGVTTIRVGTQAHFNEPNQRSAVRACHQDHQRQYSWNGPPQDGDKFLPVLFNARLRPQGITHRCQLREVPRLSLSNGSGSIRVHSRPTLANLNKNIARIFPTESTSSKIPRTPARPIPFASSWSIIWSIILYETTI